MHSPILLIDNYDSFTYNIDYILRQLNREVIVKKNDQITVDEVGNFDKILISPGPGIPQDAGIIKEIINTFSTKNILGICLGMQAIAEVFGGKIKNLNKVYHGVATHVEILEKDILFQDLPPVFEVGRYHSWVMDKEYPSNQLTVTARDIQDEIMAIKVNNHSIRGVQFHPESILTPLGEKILKNWLIS